MNLSPEAKKLLQKIESKQARVGVLGLGYVGLPLAVEFARAGFRVTGLDLDRARVAKLERGESYIPDVDAAQIRSLQKKGLLRATTNFDALKETEVQIICVPTPLRKSREPDMSYILHAAEEVGRRLVKGRLIILESTTYPGTTEEVLLPKFQNHRFQEGRDFFLAFSPERVDPGNAVYVTRNIPKVVGGVSPTSSYLAKAVYQKAVEKVITVSSARAAEMVKMFENTFRAVNIGLANELALLCHKLGVDAWEVIEAAKTKPFGFMPFYPGPGIGGHCIPIDPLYLSWKARLHGGEPRFIELASQVNSEMPHHVVDRVASLLNQKQKSLKGSKILILGAAYKKDVTDTRESPALELIRLLEDEGSQISFHDPWVPQIAHNGVHRRSVPLTAARLRQFDCIVLATDHTNVDYAAVIRHGRLILDTRNALKNFSTGRSKIHRL